MCSASARGRLFFFLRLHTGTASGRISLSLCENAFLRSLDPTATSLSLSVTVLASHFVQQPLFSSKQNTQPPLSQPRGFSLRSRSMRTRDRLPRVLACLTKSSCRRTEGVYMVNTCDIHPCCCVRRLRSMEKYDKVKKTHDDGIRMCVYNCCSTSSQSETHDAGAGVDRR